MYLYLIICSGLAAVRTIPVCSCVCVVCVCLYVLYCICVAYEMCDLPPNAKGTRFNKFVVIRKMCTHIYIYLFMYTYIFIQFYSIIFVILFLCVLSSCFDILFSAALWPFFLRIDRALTDRSERLTKDN